jgi:hypothetical protein
LWSPEKQALPFFGKSFPAAIEPFSGRKVLTLSPGEEKARKLI